MKKTLRFLGLAFVACSLFVACGDDPEEETVKDGIAVTFDTDAWEAADILGTDYSTIHYLELGAFKNYDSETTPWVQGYIPSEVADIVWPGSSQASPDYHYMFYYENDNDYTAYNNSNYPNWQPTANDFHETITAIDLTALTLSGTCTGSMRYFPDILNGSETPTTKALTVNINNATWEAVTPSSKGRVMKAMGNLAK